MPKNPNNTQDKEEDDAQINNLFVGAMWHYKRKVRERMKARLNACEITRNKSKESCIIIKDGKEYRSTDEATWYKVNPNSDTNCTEILSESIGSFDSKTWCKVCDSSDEEENNASHQYSPKRIFEAEEELKKILGMIKNNHNFEPNYDSNNEEETDDKSTFKESDSSDESVSSINNQEERAKDEIKCSTIIEVGKEKENKTDETKFYIMTVMCYDADSSEEEEESKECNDEEIIERKQQDTADEQVTNNDQVTRASTNPTIKVNSEKDENDNQGLGHARRNE